MPNSFRVPSSWTMRGSSTIVRVVASIEAMDRGSDQSSPGAMGGDGPVGGDASGGLVWLDLATRVPVMAKELLAIDWRA
jgi:hypothetical protein